LATVSYITPIMDRTSADVTYARAHQNDLTNKNKGAWNYTDANRVCNNLKYAAEYMYEKGFLAEPYSMQIKLDWTENDIMTYEQFNSMIVNNMNNLKTYSRLDLHWHTISSVANMDYCIANWIEQNINELATQEPLPPNTYLLTVNNGAGSGYYEAGTVVTIQANMPEQGLVFDHWSGEHLENIGNPTASITTYTMPNQDITLQANYTGIVPHNLTVNTYTGTDRVVLPMGANYHIEADPAPQGKVFHHWDVVPSNYENNLYEPAASTTFTMPNEDVTLTAVYISPSDKYLVVENGNGTGWYTYGMYVSVSSRKPANATFSSWSGDTQYLTGPVTSEYNSVKIPDVSRITIRANWTINPDPPVTNVQLTVVNGVITSTGETTGTFTEGDKVSITANAVPEGQTFTGWSRSGGGSITNSSSLVATVTIGKTATTATANYRTLAYHNLTVTTHSGTTTEQKEQEQYFTVNGDPAPTGYIFDRWTGDISSYGSSTFSPTSVSTGTRMGHSDRTIIANYRPLEYYTLTVTTASGTTTKQVELKEKFTVDARPVPDGYIFERWSGDTSGLSTTSITTSTTMGSSDRTIEAVYRSIVPHTLTVKQPSGDVTYSQNELSKITVTAEEVEGKVFTYWSLSGVGSISNTYSSTTTYTFGNGDGVLTPNYVNVWTITVINGTINNRSSMVLRQGSQYSLTCRTLEIYERFDGWTVDGPGTIRNTAATSTYFTVGAGNATITANITQYPDKTLAIYKRDPDTGTDSLVSVNTYTYGTRLTIEAPVAPNETTFLAWLGDTSILSPSALASSVTISSLTSDTTIIATYFYPESPEYYTLTIYDGYPESGSYAAGSQVAIRAKTPSQNWEFYKWYGDTEFLVDPDLTHSDNAVIIPLRSITLYAKFKVIGEQALYRVSVVNGVASGTYEDSHGNEHNESGVYIDVPAGTEVTLTADPDTAGWTFDYWSGNFEAAGVTDIVTTNNPTVFTMTEHDLNISMVRRELGKYTVYATNATGPGKVYPGTYPLAGNLRDTENEHYTFNNWTCVDADNNDYISAIGDSLEVSTTITVADRDLWTVAVYTTHYKLTVIDGQDTGDGYYYEGEEVTTVYANTPPAESRLVFDHWDDPMGIIDNIYDSTPTIIMRDTVATISAVFVSLDSRGNSVVKTSDDLHTGIITRENTTVINGIFSIGTIVLDADGCIGVITEVNPDSADDTNDYRVEKLFYGGNF